jgi:hypothetical protein
MKIIDYKVITRNVPIKDINKLDEFERIIKKYISEGYVPIGNVSIIQQMTTCILLQNMVKYDN